MPTSVMEILVRFTVDKSEREDIKHAADALNKTPEEIIRMAVAEFCRKCVPTPSAV